ncbi:MAG: hypothetical protein K6E29_00755 [Cyanobacteria bacterium RUI128]|nr:hypothetical protein [Cyanobacteria bacterium RUI128]
MRIGSIIKTGVLSGLISASVSGCKKAPFREMTTVPQNVVQKVDSMVKASESITKDTSYIFYGNDTLELSDKFVRNTPEFIRKMNKKAIKNTPKEKVGQHLENLMIPKRGGGFDIIPTMKTDYAPIYVEQTAVVKSPTVFTRDGKDMYIPVEYYGKKNPEIK